MTSSAKTLRARELIAKIKREREAMREILSRQQQRRRFGNAAALKRKRTGRR